MSRYIALRHLQHPVDIITEEDCAAPHILGRYRSVFVSDPNLSEQAAQGLGAWLQSTTLLPSSLSNYL